MTESIFLGFTLPNATTWFYFAFLLVVALFFQFTRLFCVRNWDLLTLFVMAPGLLILQHAHQSADAGPGEVLAGYVWLIAAGGYWFVRCLVDLAFDRRPMLPPNLTTPALAWFAVALFVCLGGAAARPGADISGDQQVGKRPIPVAQAVTGATELAKTATDTAASSDDVRFWVVRSLALACHLAVVAALVLIGAMHYGDLTAGVAAATLYLVLPYTAFHIGQLHHVWPTAFLLWAVFCYRRPTLSGFLLGLAGGTSFFPLLLFPLWFGFYSGRGAWRFGAAFTAAVAASVGLALLVLWVNGGAAQIFGHALHLSDWQPWQVPRAESIWGGAHWAYRLPVFIVYVAFVVVTVIWPAPKNLAHLLALSAATLIGVQFWYADQGGVYVLWYLPLLLLMVFRPNLTGHQPPTQKVRESGYSWPSALWPWKGTPAPATPDGITAA